MAQQLSAEETDTSDIDLEFVRGKRKDIINAITAKGIPDDTKVVGVLLMALADMDRASLGKKRIKTDVNIGNMQAQAAEMIAAMYTNPNIKALRTDVNVQSRVIELDDSLKPTSVVPGELFIGLETEDYDTFMAKQINGN